MRTTTDRATGDRPDWDPLIDLIGLELVGWFMWMYATELADGSVLHAYKHRSTRRYLHLTPDGRAFACLDPGRYRPIDVDGALRSAFQDWENVVPEPDAASLDAFRELVRARA